MRWLRTFQILAGLGTLATLATLLFESVSFEIGFYGLLIAVLCGLAARLQQDILSGVTERSHVFRNTSPMGKVAMVALLVVLLIVLTQRFMMTHVFA